MYRRNYKAECIALLSSCKSEPLFNASEWVFTNNNFDGVPRVCCVRMGKDGEEYEVMSTSRVRSWAEQADFMRAYRSGFYAGIKAEECKPHYTYIEIKSAPNRYGNCKRLYLEYDGQGSRTAVREDRNGVYLADTLQVSASEFREYAQIVKAQRNK